MHVNGHVARSQLAPHPGEAVALSLLLNGSAAPGHETIRN
jgi:hypothetical protein